MLSDRKILIFSDYEYLRVFKDIQVYLSMDSHNPEQIISVAKSLGAQELSIYYSAVVKKRSRVFRDVRTYIGRQPNAITERNIGLDEIKMLLSTNNYKKYFLFLVQELKYLEEQSWEDLDKAIAIRILYHLALSTKIFADASKVALEQ